MAGVAREKEPPEAQRLGDETAERRDALLERRSRDEPFAPLVVEPPLELLPEHVVRPVLDLVGQRDLQVVAASCAAAHRAEREAARAGDVDQLVVDRRRIREEPQPAEWIDLLVLANRILRHARAADAVEAVAAGDEVAIEAMLAAVLAIGDVRLRAAE